MRLLAKTQSLRQHQFRSITDVRALDNSHERRVLLVTQEDREDGTYRAGRIVVWPVAIAE